MYPQTVRRMIARNPSVSFGELSQALDAAWAQLSDAEKDEFKPQ